jgi:predicted MPP superfamily phosphohydrolase
MTLDQMPVEIRALSAEEKLKASEYPAYVSPEVLEVANKVNSVRKDDSIVFVAMSDSHYPADQAASLNQSYGTETVASTIQANQAAKVLAYLLDVDFFAHLGDVSCGADSTTPDMLKKQIEGFISYFREARSDLPVFICIGNHDTGIYYHDAHKDGNIHTMTGEYLYKNFTAHSESDNTVVGGRANGGYCYRDFPDKKLRVIMLNTSEQLTAKQIDNSTFGAQRAWLGNALLDLNAKSDAAAWGFIILCHYPADFGSSTMKISQLLGAYVNGNSITVTDSADGTNQRFDFSDKNKAKFYAHFHGHVHNFLHSRLYHTVSGSPVQYNVWRLCVPNGQVDRENTYGESLGINWREDESYPKTPNTEEGTSFVVNVINPTDQKIYSFCYGAGYDREIENIGPVYYSISATLRHVTSSNDALSVEAGAAYVTTLAAVDGYELQSVIVKMGGEDITSAVYSNGVINITKVTGNIVIEATAVGGQSVVNQLPISTDTDGSIYNGRGYTENTYLSSGNVKTKSGVYTSGFIPFTADDTMYFKNCTMPDNNTNCRFSFFDSTKTFCKDCHWTTESDTDKIAITYGADGNIATLTITNKTFFESRGGVAYVRFCCNYLGADSIVTVNEPIE